MTKPRMSIITASCRPEGLPILWQCLGRQSFQDFEWLIAMPEASLGKLKIDSKKIRLMAEPPKREGDFYALNKAWNLLIREAKCELLVFMVDWIWFEDDTLEKFWKHFQVNPGVGVNSLGDHFRAVDTRLPGQHKPEVFWRGDDRLEQLKDINLDEWDGYPATHWENACCSLSRSKLIEVGGFDEEYDTVAANSEKEAALRMYTAGYRFQLDQSIVIRNYTHEKESTVQEWDEAYERSCRMYRDHQQQIASGERRWAINPLTSTPMQERPHFILYEPPAELTEGLALRLHERGHHVSVYTGDPGGWVPQHDLVWIVADNEAFARVQACHRAVLKISGMPEAGWDRCVSLLTTVAYDYFKGIVKSSHRGCEYLHINHFIFGHKGEAESREAWLDVGEGDVFFDIGSALGSWSLPAAACGAKVYAFDPGTDAQMLSRHRDMNGFGDRIGICTCLVGDTNGVPVPRTEIPWSSVPQEKEQGPSETISIDQFVFSDGPIGKVSFIKIDVDGNEMAVLRGAEQTIRTYKPKVVVEIHDFLGVDQNEVTKFIAGLGYSCAVVAKEAGYYCHAYCVPLETK